MVPPRFAGSRESLRSPPTTSNAPRQNGDDMSRDLPTEFVNYVRSLFEILDQDRCGFVNITDIEGYWDAKGSSLSGVLDSLKNVAPPNGLLTFEDYCRGLRLAIRSSNSKANTTTTTKTRLDPLRKDSEYNSDSSEDSFRVHDDSRDLKPVEKSLDIQRKSSSREQLDSVPVNLSNSNLTRKYFGVFICRISTQ